MNSAQNSAIACTQDSHKQLNVYLTMVIKNDFPEA